MRRVPIYQAVGGGAIKQFLFSAEICRYPPKQPLSLSLSLGGINHRLLPPFKTNIHLAEEEKNGLLVRKIRSSLMTQIQDNVESPFKAIRRSHVRLDRVLIR